jgi:hypothetical protein
MVLGAFVETKVPELAKPNRKLFENFSANRLMMPDEKIFCRIDLL